MTFTPEEITAMAREAGLLPDNSHPAPETRAMRQRSEAVQRFATLVAEKAAAKEREVCAQVCEQVAQDTYGMTNLREYGECAHAIRARGQ